MQEQQLKPKKICPESFHYYSNAHKFLEVGRRIWTRKLFQCKGDVNVPRLSWVDALAEFNFVYKHDNFD